MAFRCIGLALAALVAGALGAPAPSSAAPANYAGASADGSVVFFMTNDSLVTGDTDGTRRDVYARAFDGGVGEGEYVTRQVSTGPIGGNGVFPAQYDGSSADGTKAFFSTDERLAAADTDQSSDLYLRDRAAGTTDLVSRGVVSCAPGCGNGVADAGFVGVSDDGEIVYFVTAEQLDPTTDTDSVFDVYARDLVAQSTTLVTAGKASCAPACGNGAFNATLRGVTFDGSRAFFTTAEKLDPTVDTDAAADIYARDYPSGPTTLVSQGASSCAPACGNSGAVPVFRGSFAGGSRVFFTTDEPLASGDGDTATDVYARDLPSGPTMLVSAGTDPSLTANFAAASVDGAHAFFATSESLDSGDTNGATDIYRWSGIGPSLVTSGTCCGSTFNAATADGATVVFTTNESLGVADTDSKPDVYVRTGAGAPTLASVGANSCVPDCGNDDDFSAIFSTGGLSSDGTKVFFTTAEQLAPLDTDSVADIYVHDLTAPATTLSSTTGVCPLGGGCPVVFSGISGDGAHVFFQSEERLTAEDVDSEADVYERAGGETRIVSAGNTTALGPATPVLERTDPPLSGESTTPRIIGQADPNTSIKLYVTADCSGAPVATGTSLELGGAGIGATVLAGTTTSFRATATDSNGDTSACSLSISYTQQTPPPPPPPPADDPGSGSGGDSGVETGTASSLPRFYDGGIAFVTPQIRITFGPAFKTRKRKAVFRFVDSTGQPGTRFACKLDRSRWKSCDSPTQLKGLRLGRHVFAVKAVNAAGVWLVRPVERKFKVVG